MKRNWFSNFYLMDEPMVHSDLGMTLSYPTVEHFFCCMKTENPEQRIALLDFISPAKIKVEARKVKLRPDWHLIKKSVMWTALCWKFRNNTSHGVNLMNTEGQIVEWNYWHDNYWGHCVCKKCEDKHKQNILGKMLVDIRCTLRGG